MVWCASSKNNNPSLPPFSLPHTHPTPQQWQELAELYLRTGHPGEAAFCYEELVLCSPANFAFHIALAETYVAVGGGEPLRLARKHFAQAMELHSGDDNLRALYGMCAVSGRQGGEECQGMGWVGWVLLASFHIFCLMTTKPPSHTCTS